MMLRFQNRGVARLKVYLLPAAILPVILCHCLLAQDVNSRTGSADETLEQLKKQGASRSRYLLAGPSLANSNAEKPTQPKSDLKTFENEIQPILTKACVKCHGPELDEANIRIDTLNPDLVAGDDVDWWLEVFAVIGNGEMPPPDETKLSEADRTKVIDWLAKEIQIASSARRASAKHSSFRRMTRYEFNYALQDLLGLPWDFAKDLPPEPISPDGFQNSSEMLHMSVTQLETYRELALKALKRATVGKVRPKVLYWGINMKDAGKVDWGKQAQQLAQIKKKHQDDPEKQRRELEKRMASFKSAHRKPYYKQLSTGRTAPATWSYPKAKYANLPSETRPEIPGLLDHVAIIPAGRQQRLTIELGDRLPDEGIMRVRVRAARTSTEAHSIPSLQLEFGWQASNEGRAQMRISSDTPIEAPVGNPKFYQWDIPLGDIYPRNSVRKRSSMGSMPNPSEYIRLVNSSPSGDDILVDYVEVITPVYDQWPPLSHQKIFFASKNRKQEDQYAHEILQAFMKRAWRRNATEAEIQKKIKLFKLVRQQCDSFEEAMVEVLATVLGSPKFLYVVSEHNTANSKENKHSRITDHELATRLSMFLWSSIPDEQLLKLAENKRLHDPTVLANEVDRMLRDPRSRRLSKHFVHQWLHLQILDFLDLKQNHPQFAGELKESMRQEPTEYFQLLLNQNGNILDFIHSDYVVVDERLANHYGLPDIRGNHFRKVKLAKNQNRGGLLTQAGTLTMNSDGTDSHPLKRGIWLLECILNDPPPPPPPAVPEIDLADPEIAKMTLKERIENHRNHAACRSCHSKIDPWGIAFEHYDAVGRYRKSIKGRAVDATSKLFNEQELSGMDGLKRFLLMNRQDQFVRATVHKMTTYALGRPLTFADRSSVDKITTDVRKQGDRLATMVKLIVTSDLFQAK